MIYLNKPYVLIEWDEDLRCVKVEWRGFVDGREYRDALDVILQALTDHRGTKLLADARGMRAVTPEDQAWLNKDWVPRSVTAGLKHSAVVLPKSAVAQLSLQRIVSAGQSGVRTPPSMNEAGGYFDNLEDAKKWIRSRR
jgi:hypothetical protein